MSEQPPRDPNHVQTYRDADACFSMARALWKGVEPKPTPEALQATFATLMIHVKDLRTRMASLAQQARTNGRPQENGPVSQPQQGDGFPAACPTCGGKVYDNRKDGPDKPAWRCKNKECKDAKGYITSEWSFKKKGQGQRSTAYAQAAAIRNDFDRQVPQKAEDFEEMPQALDQDDSDLPF